MVQITKKEVGEGINTLYYLELKVDGRTIDDSALTFDDILSSLELDHDDLIEEMNINEEMLIDKTVYL